MSGDVPQSSHAPLRVGAVLSLSGPYSRFGVQAAQALQLWAEWDGDARIEVVDDTGDAGRATESTHELAPRVDLLLGPYSTLLTNAAAKVVRESGGLLWNHGGSGTHVERGFGGHVVSVLTPTNRYAEPFLHHVESLGPINVLWIAEGAGRFARQVARGAAEWCRLAGIVTRRVKSADLVRLPGITGPWTLFSAGSFEEDVQVANWATATASPPRVMCAVGAGVHEFGQAVGEHEGVFGVAQWTPGGNEAAELGPAEAPFLGTYQARWGQRPDYPGVQALAGAAIAVHCARLAGETGRLALWHAACALRVRTMFGRFEIEAESGEQVAHQMALVRWAEDRLVRAG